MTDHDKNLIESKQNESIYYMSHLGVNIDKLENGFFYTSIWSDEKNQNVEIENNSLYIHCTEIEEIISYNYYQSLKKIAEHFGHKKDFNNPEQNLDNLLDSLRERLSDAFNEPS